MKVFNIEAFSSLAFIFDEPSSLKGKHLLVSSFNNLEKLKNFLQFKKTNFTWYELPPFPYPKSPHAETTFINRLSFLSFAKDPTAQGLFLASPQALLKKTSPQLDFFILKKGDLFPHHKFDSYQKKEFVEKAGDLADRSFLIDVFSPVYKTPLRIELLGDSIQSISLLDRFFKKRERELDQALFCSLHEWSLEPSFIKKLCESLRNKEQILNSFLPEDFYKSSARGKSYFGFEALYNILDNYCSLDFFSDSDSVYLLQPEQTKESFLKEKEKWQKEHAFFDSENLFLDWKLLDQISSIKKETDVAVDKKSNSFSLFKPKENIKEDLKKLPVPLIVFSGLKIEEFKKYLLKENIIQSIDSVSFQDKSLIFIQKSLKESFVYKKDSAYIKIEHWQKEEKKDLSFFDSFRKRARALEFSELEIGDLLIHRQHGLGEFDGLQSLNLNGRLEDFIVLKYKGGDKLFVPAYKAIEIKKYSKKTSSSFSKKVLLDSLGRPGMWERKKSKAKKHIQSLAIELIELYKARKQKKRPPFQPVDLALKKFEEDFPWEKTYDQKRAIQEIMSDMDREYVMDRLLIGDTGFGKTEVALNCAFRVLENNYQVCFLAPTTVLTLQHFKNFKERFKNTRYKLALLNRFASKKDKEKIFQDLKQGSLDFLVATHSALNPNLSFKNLGLLVIDEEHRFGVSQKEKLFRFRKKLDVLSLSATPIPRTLNMALTGIKDISAINQAPKKRKPVKILLKSWEHSIEKEIAIACRKEKSRGGQVIFIYNRVKSLHQRAEHLSRILPDFKIAIAHGKTPNLDKIMLDFFKKKYDLLLSSNIVESGLDIPQANTMFIDRAHEMGLSQIYQLKGRVGRAEEQAYCYLLYPERSRISLLAQERLRLLKTYAGLGSSFQLALHDLENRGAGSLFGAEQSGHIESLGEELYFEILNEHLKSQKEVFIEPDIQLPFTAGIPSNYIADPRLRLLYYKSFSESLDEEEKHNLKIELRENFGAFPEELKNLLFLLDIRDFCKKYLIKSFKLSSDHLTLIFHEECQIPSEKVIKLLDSYKGRMLSDHSFKLKLESKNFKKELEKILTYFKT